MALHVHVTRFHLTNHGAGVLSVSVPRDGARLLKLLTKGADATLSVGL